jgi:hypothetical protein
MVDIAVCITSKHSGTPPVGEYIEMSACVVDANLMYDPAYRISRRVDIKSDCSAQERTDAWGVEFAILNAWIKERTPPSHDTRLRIWTDVPYTFYALYAEVCAAKQIDPLFTNTDISDTSTLELIANITLNEICFADVEASGNHPLIDDAGCVNLAHTVLIARARCSYQRLALRTCCACFLAGVAITLIFAGAGAQLELVAALAALVCLALVSQSK